MQFLRQKPFPHLLFSIFAIAALMQWISTPIALIAGFLITQIFGNPFGKKLQAKYVKLLLQIAVVGLGFGMNLHNVLEVGKDGLGLTIFSISLTLVAGIIIGKALGLDRKITHLVSSGTSIFIKLNSFNHFSTDWRMVKSYARSIWSMVCHCYSRYKFCSRRGYGIWRKSIRGGHHR